MSFPLYKIEFAQLRTPRGLVPYVLSCTWCVMSPVPRAQRSSCPTSSRALLALCPRYSRMSCASCLACSYDTRAFSPACLVHHVPHTIPAFVPHVPFVLRAFCAMCLRALWALFPYVTLIPRSFHTLCANIIFCALAFPCLKLLFFCSSPTFDFFGEFTKVRTIWLASNSLKWGSAFMICLTYLKPNIKTYICETKNHFGTIEGEFKAQHDNHKNSSTHCINLKATELSNKFGT